MLRKLIIIATVLFSQFTLALSYTLEITEQELQEKLLAMKPVEKNKYFVKIKMTEPKIDLMFDSNEIEILAGIEAIIPGGLKGNVKIKVKGSLRYDKNKGVFYLQNGTIVNMNIENISEKYIPTIQKLTQNAITKALRRYPVYKFKDDNLKHKLAKATLDSIEVKNEILFVTLSIF